MSSVFSRIWNRLSPARRELRRLGRLPRGVAIRTRLIAPEFEAVDGVSFAAQYEQIFVRKEYAFRSRAAAPRVLDCGANVGTFTVYCARHLPGSRIVAFEPDPQVFAVLQRNVSRCCPAAAIDLVNAAVCGADRKSVWFHADGCDTGRIKPDEGGDTIEVRAVRLRDYLAEPCALLNLDIEGSETEVLRDCGDLLRAAENIFVEYHSFVDRPQELDDLLSILRGAGFRYYIRSGKVPSLPFHERPSFLGMDLQLDIWAVRDGGP